MFMQACYALGPIACIVTEELPRALSIMAYNGAKSVIELGHGALDQYGFQLAIFYYKKPFHLYNDIGKPSRKNL